MWFGGPLDDALLNVQDLLEEVEAAARMTRTLSTPLVLVLIAPGALISMLQNGFGVMDHRLEQFGSATVHLFIYFG
jgi:hypothetical protein